MAATPVNGQNLTIKDTYNFEVPCEGAKVIPLLLDFSAFTEYDIDLSQLESQSRFSMLQTIFIDLSDTATALVVIVTDVLQQIVANGHTQGYYPILVPNPSKLQIQCLSGQVERLHLINVPIAGSVWAATHP